MKKALTLLLALTITSPVYATDYVYEAFQTLRQCKISKQNCASYKKYTNDGMYYYFQRRNESYENLKNYCMLLGLRINAMMYDGNGQLSKDMFNIQRYCSGVQL